MDNKRRSVSQLLSYLYNEPYGFVPMEYLTEGTDIHNWLGYNNGKKQVKELDSYTIAGIPDLVIPRRKLIVELKTTRREDWQDLARRATDQAHIYAWMMNYKQIRVDMYHMDPGLLVEGKVYKADYRRARKQIRRAVKFEQALNRLMDRR